jgi:hypothetical protein
MRDRIPYFEGDNTKAIEEALSTQISAIDEKYADLPARMSRLETTVFGRGGR